MRRHSRHEVAQQEGRRISKGEWERRNKAYNVYLVKVQRFRTGKLDENGQEILAVKKSYTYVRHPDTPMAFRKQTMRERFAPSGTKRSRFLPDRAVGMTR